DQVFRDHRGAFETSDARFVGEYRLTKGVTRWLCGQLRGKLKRRREGPRVLTVEQQVLSALRFYAAGGFQGTAKYDLKEKLLPVTDAHVSELLFLYMPVVMFTATVQPPLPPLLAVLQTVLAARRRRPRDFAVPGKPCDVQVEGYFIYARFIVLSCSPRDPPRVQSVSPSVIDGESQTFNVSKPSWVTLTLLY
ncbi:hypothetical protein HPB47_011189, partial [Ixodes persulcatus]